MTPGFIGFAVSYSFGTTAFADFHFSFTFKHFVSLLFYIRIVAW